jgi:integrase
MSSLTKRPSGIYWLQFTLDGRKHTRSLGRIDRGLAMSICGKFETLMSEGKTGQAMETVTAQVAPEQRQSMIHLWVQEYLKALGCKPATMKTHYQTLDLLTAQFGTCSFRDVDFTGAQKFVASLGRFAGSTRAKHISRTRQYFDAAIDSGIISKNPFESFKCGSQHNPTRSHFVSREDYEKLMAAAPNQTLRTIISLSRIGGLRIPSELRGLKWTDIEAEKISITGHKTASRAFPMFPELKEELNALSRNRMNNGTVISYDGCLTYALRQIIQLAGLKRWPRIWHNMRASRITELSDKFPVQVVSTWMGNSPEIALRHYLSVTDSHWEQALNETRQDRT